MTDTRLPTIPLGIQVAHSDHYNPDHLFPVPRTTGRTAIGITDALPFKGVDIWNAYEVSWLDAKGKPMIGLGEFCFLCTSSHIVESKSLKLYLNSLNQTRFDSPEQVTAVIRKDLSRCSGEAVQVTIHPPEPFAPFSLNHPEGTCIDHIDISVEDYEVNPGHLGVGEHPASEVLYSNLLRTNCPVTGQPDWATVTISYKGAAIDHPGLLKYLISFRLHTGFHENCVEQIFTDITRQCRPDALSVYARFTRRGGIDINPYRTSTEIDVKNTRLVRQ